MDKPFRILISDHLHPDGWRVLDATPEVTSSGPYTTRQEVLQAIRDADALIVRSTTRVDAELMQAAPGLKVIARAGAQLNNVDLDTATRLGIMVINAPTANITAVAEHTFAMLLALARQIPQSVQAVQRGEWPRHETLGFQLSGKLLGIVGFGRLGREVALRAQAFGMKVLAYDPYVDLAAARAQGVEIVNLDELLQRADIVSLHTAYTPQTHHLMDASAFQQMKPGGVFINVTHAGLMDESALLNALENGQLSGAAIDTLAVEPPPMDHPLLHHPRVIATPHLNQNTVESQSTTSVQVVEDVLAALRGQDYRRVVNLPFNEQVPYLKVKPYIHLAVQLGKLQGQVAEGWITRVEVEVLGEGLRDLVRPVAAVLLSGMLLPVDGRRANWVSAPVLAFDQGIRTAQAKDLAPQADYPNLIACRVYWEADPTQPVGPENQPGHRTVAGVLFGNGEARLVLYDQFPVDAYPEGYVLILENNDKPGVIGMIGTRLGKAGINIAQWRYGRDQPYGRAVSFINLDSRPPRSLLSELEAEAMIQRVRLVKL
jgi:D-3-phosphoglycerate dehydrogenase / 2-oxoglutarate reductase